MRHNAVMGVLTDYFSAPSDEAAASVLDRPGGPVAGPVPLPFDAVESKGLDPHVVMGKLEEALTGQDYWAVTTDPQYARVILARGDGGPWVFKVSSRLQAALAAADGITLARAAVEWSQAEELQINGVSPDMSGILEDLAGLARRAAAKEEHLYCWVSL
ncbi:MAG: hypothetical protein JWM19_2700 [Actinomycetia bacterium]|nr:hypothetical protein [Actinomycetes bacterium]